MLVRVLQDAGTRLRALYHRLTADSYEDYYQRLTKQNVRENPEACVGPEHLFDEMATWQLRHLFDHGLHPSDRLLDLGCGVLRGGLPLITYLDTGCYTGMDICHDALAVGAERLIRENLFHKRPRLVKNEDLTLAEIPGTVDWIWAQSLLTHLPPDRVTQLLEHAPTIMTPSSTFHATIYTTDDGWETTRHGLDHHYAPDTLDAMAQRHGLTLTVLPDTHPNDLTVVRLQLDPDGDVP